MRYIFIINPIAGKGNGVQIFKPQIEEYFKKKRCYYRVYVTTCKREAVEIARSEAQKGIEVRIFACGGDGTMFDVVNGIRGYNNAELGIIPCGSGNDFLKYFGKKADFLDIDQQVRGTSFELDLIKAGDWYSINQCSMGMDAEICLNKDKFSKLPLVTGKMAYTISALYCLFKYVKNHYRITIDDNPPVEGDFLFAVAANAQYYGGGFKSAPFANACDGLLDCIRINSISRLRFISLLKVYKAGKHINMPGICTFDRAKKMTVESENEASVNMDGEVISAKSITFEIVEKAIKFIVPKKCVEKTVEVDFSDNKMGSLAMKPAEAFVNKV